jgi:hypothetical protein
MRIAQKAWWKSSPARPVIGSEDKNPARHALLPVIRLTRARNVACDRAFVLVARVTKPQEWRPRGSMADCVGFDTNPEEKSLSLRWELESGNWSS